MQVIEFEPSPMRDPTVYPGRWLSASSLLVDRTLLALRPVTDRRLEQAKVHVEPGIARLTDYAGREIPLSLALLLMNATPMAKRRPFIAVGSNANPAQLVEKLAAAHQSLVVPMTVVDAVGLGIGYSSHTSVHHYIPTAPYLAAEERRSLVVTWLDELQAAALNQTEPNYDDLVLDCAMSQVTLTLDSGETVPEAVIFRSVHGVRTDDRQEVIAFQIGDGPYQPRQEGAPLVQDGFVGAPGWKDGHRYGEMSGIDGAAGYAIRPTGSGLDRDGDTATTLSTEDHTKLGQPTHVLVTATATDADVSVGLVTRALVEPKLGAGEVGLDQLTRNALGVETRERAHLRGLGRRPRTPADVLLPHPTSAVCRVQPAESVSMEREIAMLDAVAMGVIGVSDGDLVVIEGVPLAATPDVVPSRRLRVVAATDEFMERRRGLIGGGPESRFPSALDALGVWPDLPWIYLDSDTRTELGLGASRLAAVRVRASRRDQLSKEMRELLLVIAVALVGVVAVVQDYRWLVAWIALIGGFVVTVVWLRLRRRISKT